MELNAQIKKYRTELQISQEELAEKVYVTRQTISNWETGKCYPDIHSLLLLSSCFHVSLDQLVKGDMETMKELVSEHDIQEFNRYGWIYAVHFVLMILSIIPLAIWRHDYWYAWMPFGIMTALALFWAVKVEKLKKKHDIQTYREIVAFTEGKKLDEIQKATEAGKRPYQTILKALTGAAVGAMTIAGIEWLLHIL